MTDEAHNLKLKTLFRMQWEPAQDAHVLLYPEGMVKLNQSAAEILKRCDGTRNIDTLIADLEQAFNTTGIGGEVRSFVAEAQRRGWLE
ncbi:pyrroloquinoline quinone biosynthesis peptide chaperone PqqD [Paraburkholderia kururiensis]|uniref:Pyrroloquinoline quinone biosynthesis peptide chaperone PqqD n=1 Tax=Paraburkholderia kururiensis TaxID=984307 RepID=A0ABZ0WMW8_9BURK|nr:pyrroloquinoline quinone biosynthesis peptide chaperone PqqD [Paraburkholderia kururiensis]WQD78591.1 pyrroloquinoline quinone biosynthesis peptide chaperone PqqD [Paraburkholderia kururiensis]